MEVDKYQQISKVPAKKKRIREIHGQQVLKQTLKVNISNVLSNIPSAIMHTGKRIGLQRLANGGNSESVRDNTDLHRSIVCPNVIFLFPLLKAHCCLNCGTKCFLLFLSPSISPQPH